MHVRAIHRAMMNVHRLFCLCVILFCTDDRCYLPLHALITDAVESYSGSTILIQMLNRLGACSSTETLARVIQCRVQESEKSGDEQECNCNAFTIISARNIDFLHSYAQVYCGTQNSSWHGTTVQVVQPKLNFHAMCTNFTVPPPTQCTSSNIGSPKQTMPGLCPSKAVAAISQGK